MIANGNINIDNEVHKCQLLCNKCHLEKTIPYLKSRMDSIAKGNEVID